MRPPIKVTRHFASPRTKRSLKQIRRNMPRLMAAGNAGGASKGKKVLTKPELWAIVGQLYLCSSPKVITPFLANTGKVISKGESNWKVILPYPVSSCAVELAPASPSYRRRRRYGHGLLSRTLLDGECRYMHLAI